MINTPAEIAAQFIDVGTAKARLTVRQTLILGFFAGAFIALAGVGASAASVTIASASVAKLVGACVFPVGLAVILLAGGELFTGNNLMVISLLEKKISLAQLLRNWVLVYIGNIIGAAFIAALAAFGHVYLLFGGAFATSVADTAVYKVGLSFQDALLKGVLCNILVCGAVWVAASAKTSHGKVISLFLPVMLFVLCGFEHSVANMYYIAAGIFESMDPAYASLTGDMAITFGGVLKNLVPVTLGNIIGGSGVIGVGYWLVYLKK